MAVIDPKKAPFAPRAEIQSAPASPGAMTTLSSPSGFSSQQKSSLEQVYKSQWAEAAKKTAEFMQGYNANKTAPAKINPSLSNADPLLGGAKSQGTKMNMDTINTYRAQSGLDFIGDVYSTTGKKYDESASGSAVTNALFEGQENVPSYGQPGGTETAPENQYEVALKAERQARANVEAQRAAAVAEAENIRNMSATSQRDAGVAPTTPGTVPKPLSSPTSGLQGYQAGIMAGKDQFFEDTGVNDQIDALTAEKNRLKGLLGDDTLSDSQKSQIQAQYDAANKSLEAGKTQRLSEVERAKEESRIAYDSAIERQKVTNAQMLESSQKMAALTGASFSTGGMTGLNSILEQGQAQINELQAKKANLMAGYQDKHDAIVSEYQAKVQENLANMNVAITNKYNDTVSAINKIDADIGNTTKEGVKELRWVAKDYMEFVDKAADRTFKENQALWDKTKFAIETNMKQDENDRKYATDIFESAFKNGNLYGVPTSQIDSLNLPDEMKTLLKGGIVRDTITAMNEYGKSVGYGDLGTRYSNDIRKGIAGGLSSADVVSSLSKSLNLPLMKAEDESKKSEFGWQNIGNGKLVRTKSDGTYEVIDGAKKSETIRSKGILSTLGNGKITGYGGAYDGGKGLDVDGTKGDPVMGFAGKVVSVIDANFASSPYGNSVVIEDADGNQIRLSHLDSLNVQPGQEIRESDLLGTLGNTGNVIPGPNGDGSHLDIRVKPAGANTEMSSRQVEQFLGSYGRGASKSGGTGVDTDYGVPIEYDRRIKSLVPTQLMNSDTERESLEANILNLHQNGIEPEDAVLAYMGVNVPPERKAKAIELIQLARGLGDELQPSFYTNISGYLSNGDVKGAEDFVMRKVDNVVKKNEGDDAVSTPSLRFAGATMKKLDSFIEKNKDKIGPVSGRFSEIEKNFVNDPEYQALKTLLTGSLADVRKYYAGSAVTETELKALRDTVGIDTTMPIQNFITALHTNFDQKKSKYDSQRSFLGIDENMGSEPSAGYMSPAPASQATQPNDEYSAWLSGGSAVWSSWAGTNSWIVNPFAR